MNHKNREKAWGEPIDRTIEKFSVENSALRNRVRSLNDEYNRTQDAEEKARLEALKKACEAYLETCEKPIKNEQDFETALDQIDTNRLLLKGLERGKLDEKRLSNLLRSDIAVFFDSKFQGDLSILMAQLTTADRTAEVTQYNPEKIKHEAEAGWFQFMQDQNAEIKKLEAELREKKHSSKKADKERAQWIEEYLPFMREELKVGRSAWMHKRERQLENEKLPDLSKSIGEENRAKMESYVVNAIAIRLNAVKEHLKTRFFRLRDHYDKLKENFGHEDRERFKELFDTFQSDVFEGAVSDPKVFTKISENIEGAFDILSEMAGVSQSVNRPKVKSQFRNIKQQLGAIRPDQISDLKKQIQDQPEGAIKTRSLKVLDDLFDPNSLVSKEADVFEKKLDDMDSQEALETQEELKQIQLQMGVLIPFPKALDKTLHPETMSDSDKARLVIQKLANLHDAEKIRKVLSENLDPKHVEYVSESVFEEKYRAYTMTGFMVFYERGDEWKIIINEDEIKKENIGNKFNEQLTHELLHLEFEKNEGLKALWVNAFTQNNLWPEIKSAFVKLFSHKSPPGYKGNKKTFSADDWKDEDIISELYAMQYGLEETFKANFKERRGAQRMSELIVKSGLALQLFGGKGNKNKEVKIRGFDSMDELIRGSEHADESHGHEDHGHDDHGHEDHGHEEGHDDHGHGGGGHHDLRLASDLNQENHHIQGGLDEILKSEYLDHIPGGRNLVSTISKYNKKTAELCETYDKIHSKYLAKTITDRNDKVRNALKTLNKEIGDVAESLDNTSMSQIRKIWINTKFLSVYDIMEMFHGIHEFFHHRHEKVMKDNAGRLGVTLFGGTSLGSHFLAEHKHAEAAYVKEWQERYEELDAWELEDKLKEMTHQFDPSKDQLKAILRLLAEKGRLNWHNPDLWKVLNKVQSASYFAENDPVLHHNPIAFRQKMHTAFSMIFDKDEFLKLEKNNEHEYEHGMDGFKVNFERMADQMNTILDGMLARHIRSTKGEHVKKVEPIEYEAAIRFCIDQGKGSTENIFFHIMAGIAYGLLPPDRGLALDDKYLNEWPATQWIYSFRPPLSNHDFHHICHNFFPNDFENGKMSDEFKYFYWTQVMNNTLVKQRTRKAASDHKWDHDWGRAIVPMGDADSAKRFLEGRSGRKLTQATAAENMYVGALQWLEMNALHPENVDIEDFKRQIAWITMSDGIMDNIAYRSNKIMTRDSGWSGNVPREAGEGFHEKWNLGQHREKLKKFVSIFDPTYFKMLRDTTALIDEPNEKEGEAGRRHGRAVKEYLISTYGTQMNAEQMQKISAIQNIDDVFEETNIITDVIIKANAHKLGAAIQFLANDSNVKEGKKAIFKAGGHH